jgi:predicted transglutaminase-like cysteine proteinase
MRILAQLALLGLAIACCSSSRAEESSYIPSDVIEGRVSAIVRNQRAEKESEKEHQIPNLSQAIPAQNDHDEQRAIQSSVPTFDDLTGHISAQWADLQSRIRSEQETLAACLANSRCPAAARQFLQIVELGRQRQGRARLAEINRAVNFSIKPLSDWAQYGVADFWSSPLATLGAGAGDCEDYAVLKYVALLEAGIVPNDLRLLIVYDPRRGTNHAVVAVHLHEEWLILDSHTLIMVTSSDARYYRPLFVLDHRHVGVVGFAGVGNDLQTPRADPDGRRTVSSTHKPRPH